MDAAPAPLDTLLDLEQRHEELLVQLDELDKRVESVLKECLAGRGESKDDSSTAATQE
jgi:hypothetical protein